MTPPSRALLSQPNSDLSDPSATLLIKTVPANGRSAADLFRRSGWGSPAFLLEGEAGGWFDGRFSLLGGSPFALFQSHGETVRIGILSDREEAPLFRRGDPLANLQIWLDRFRPHPSPPGPLSDVPFLQGGAVGFFSYDLGRRLENIPAPVQNDLSLPDIDLLFLNFFILFDHHHDQFHLIYNPLPEILLGSDRISVYKKGVEKMERLEEKLEVAIPDDEVDPPTAPLRIDADLSSEEFVRIVRRAKEYISAGDIFQVNLSHRFSLPFPRRSSFPLYRRLREINPSPFSAYLDMGEIQIVSGSPERLVRVENGRIETRPIAGTRPRGKNNAEEEEMIRSLYRSEKERAEHLMLVDLERNDLGRVCRYGSVRVDRLMALEKYSHVLHLVSHIQGELNRGVSSVGVIQALFPGGTITGAPKIRSMEIISELERRHRGIYTGAIGYLGFDGSIDLNIAIRTCIRRGDEMTFQVGAGIVADSDPPSEYEETLQKAAALIKALETP